MARYKIFICHMNVDKKPLLTGLLRELAQDDRFEVWIDNPAGCDAAIAAYLRPGIPAGSRWQDHINRVLADADCVLACISRSYVDRQPNLWRRITGNISKLDQYEREILIADAADKLACCRLDDIDLANFPPNTGRAQVTDLTNSVMFERQTRELRDGIFQVAERVRLGTKQKEEREQQARETTANRMIEILPLLAGRDEQEDQISKALKRAYDDSGRVYPLVVYGPRNELPEGFVDRLLYQSNHLLPPGGWFQVTVNLPTATADFAESYRGRLERQLDENRRGEAQTLAAKLIAIGSPICIVHLIDAAAWSTGIADRVRHWLRTWKAIAAEASTAPLVPLLCITLPDADPGWHRTGNEDAMPPDPPIRTGDGNLAIRDALRAIATEAADGTLPPFWLTSVLPPLYKTEADTWSRARRDLIEARLSLSGSAVEERIAGLFTTDRLPQGYIPAADGLNLKRFRDAFIQSGQGRIG